MYTAKHIQLNNLIDVVEEREFYSYKKHRGADCYVVGNDHQSRFVLEKNDLKIQKA